METSREIKYIGYFLVILFIVFILFVIILNLDLKNSSLIKSDTVIGRSMEPTFHDGDIVNYDISKLNPIIGDIIAFNCFTEKCINGDSSTGKLKRLIGFDNRGCYWFEGDNKDISWDSSQYGFLCAPDDIKIIGTVISFTPKGSSIPQQIPTFKAEETIIPEIQPMQPIVKKSVSKNQLNITRNDDSELLNNLEQNRIDREFSDIMKDSNKPHEPLSDPLSIPEYVAPPTPTKLPPVNFNPRICIPQKGIMVCNND